MGPPLSRSLRHSRLARGALAAALLTTTAAASGQEPRRGHEPPAEEPPASPPENNPDEPPIDVSVEGARGAAPRAARDPDVASYVVRGDALRRPGATAADAIAASPGVQAARSGAGSDLATVSIRGAPSAQIPVYLAGVRLNDDVTGTADLSAVPLFALDRVEVYRGNAPTDADRLGIGGAIFFEPLLPRRPRVGASVAAGSFGALSIGAFGAVGGDRAGALFSFVRESATNDFTFVDGRGTASPSDDRTVTRENGDATGHDAWAIGRVDLPRGGRLVLLANVFAREQGVVGTTADPARHARSATARELFAASARVPCAAASTPGAAEGAIERCALELTTSALLARRDLSDPFGELGFLSTRASVAGERWQQAVRVRARAGERLTVRGGLFAGFDRLGIDLAGGPATRASRLSVNGTASVSWDVTDALTLFALGAGECVTSLGAAGGGACGAGGPAGRAGARWLTPLGITVTASGGSYVRVPTLGELHGLSGSVLGNAALASERGATGELGARWGGDAADGALRWYADVTGFGRFVEDLIAYRLTSRSTIAPFNVGAARVLGVEALAGADALRHVRAEVAVTLLDPRDVTPGRLVKNDLLPYHAALTSAAFLEVYTDPSQSVHFVSRVGVGARLLYRSARFADEAGLAYLAEIRDLGLDASATFLGGRLTARFSATNLLDVQNQDVLGFALPGRAFHGSVAASYW